jgi:hypothetical protein
MKQFEGLLNSEIKKAEKVSGGKVTSYSSNGANETGFVTVRCEICTGYGSDAERLDDVYLSIYMPDRRRSFASRAI